MATEGDVELELETETSGPERPPEKPRKHDSGAADLERVTDYAEEKEIQSSNLETAMSVIGDRRSREQKAKQERVCQKSFIWKAQLGMILPGMVKTDDRDGDLTSSSRTELEGTHGQCGRGSYCLNQLIFAFSDPLTGLFYFNKDLFLFCNYLGSSAICILL
ncbi:huntingtin-interacting protein K isoform X1 [Acinonyx jubatus]|uniref:Huntingtin-interacting protein K isoform X1 n=1 Tax=Acinonyx jubatus TaxID=32536 RepID=A0A6I9ZJR1_ACIJB|nr:huntingtin-interacting protein K isoform X1 [Acinonyx jubatus]